MTVAQTINYQTAVQRLNEFGKTRTPCLFIMDFSLQQCIVQSLDTVDSRHIRYDFRGASNAHDLGVSFSSLSKIRLKSLAPPIYRRYRRAFQQARQAFVDGNSYLLNLCAASPVKFVGNLENLFAAVQAPYRLLVRPSSIAPGSLQGFLVFSPEPFVRIQGNSIAAFPMKGSLKCLPSDLEMARTRLMENSKELAEHITIVDLIRNDLSRVAQGVKVDRFRFLEEIRLPEAVLLQTSSEISGQLPVDWPDQLGSLLSELLPAGSISGAPKLSTLRVIQEAENDVGGPRGWYTGICGMFDGQSLDSAVMIRFLEDHGSVPGSDADLRQGVFRSGGGLTIYSRPQPEYRELVAKIALPIPPVLLETIRIEDGRAWNLDQHRQRISRGFQACYGEPNGPQSWSLDLIMAEALQEVTRRGGTGRWRCRLLYRNTKFEWSVEPYKLRRPRYLYLVDAQGLEYSHKYLDRRAITALREAVAAKLEPVDFDWDILLVRDGLILDTSYSAVIIESNEGLTTPRLPLLPSTRIASLLLESGDALGPKLRSDDIKVSHLAKIKRIFLINAMIGLEDAVTVEAAHIRMLPQSNLKGL